MIIAHFLLQYGVELHIIFGPTATSKTKVAQGMWERYHYPILSVDSRKVYKGADIGTNKLSILKFCEQHQDVLFGGIDFLEPNEEVSAYVYQQEVYRWLTEHEEQIQQSGGLIIHGGTGLYLDAILEGKSLLAPKNEELRASLSQLSVIELQSMAESENAAAFSQLNPSDRANPRRLIRLIENNKLTTSVLKPYDERGKILFEAEKIWHVNPPPREELYKVIDARVYEYLKQGWLDEIAGLLERFGPTAPALQMMGYRQIVEYMSSNMNWKELVHSNDKSFVSVIEEIQREHRRYAKRQETWGKKYITLLGKA